MANMSYCRFSNTVEDLQDCYDALDEGKKLSSDERRAALELLEICKNISDEFDIKYITELKED